MSRQLPQLCPTCSQGHCEYRDGILCRAYICAKRNGGDARKSYEGLMGILNTLKSATESVARNVT